MQQFWLLVKDFFGKIINVFITFKFVDFLDILLIALLLYALIKIMRETRAVQLVKGVILLAAVYLIVTILGMQASTFVFSKLFEGAIIILVILFQQEIRHALEGFGRRGWSTFSFLSEKAGMQSVYVQATKSSINAVCEACSDMSARKIGGLIVFENHTKLGEIIETGTKMDADMTSELVQNVFFPKAPLHDGALIVREGRAFAARCILPLTQDSELDGELGTRHRAALGMSEQSDAVVVTVSEETGSVSVAYRGSLERNLSSFLLKERLTSYLIGQAEQESSAVKFKRLFGGENNEKKQ